MNEEYGSHPYVPPNHGLLGLLKQETKTISGTSHTTSYAYDRQGNTASTTYPDSSVVNYIYNDAGQLNKTQRKEASDGGYTDVVSATNYTPLACQQPQAGDSQ